MLNIDEVNNTIIELENGDTTFDACIKLAALYTVKQHYKHSETDSVVSELSDILPQYRKYVNIKKRYQLGELAEIAVENQIKRVCKEISEFIHTLYSGTDMPIEREYIKDMLNGLQNL